jgi:hypothetical protein
MAAKSVESDELERPVAVRFGAQGRLYGGYNAAVSG